MRYYSKHYPGSSVRRFKTNYQADLKESMKMPEEDSEGTVQELVSKKEVVLYLMVKSWMGE